jgi:16S rRNA (cytosine967-C5)-methyltransferase
LRHRILIDLIIQAFAGCPVKRISRSVLAILRPAVYELVFCPETPVYALVNEAVGLAGKHTGRKQSGFVNAVLRSIDRQIKVRHTDTWVSQIQATAPIDEGCGCVFKQDFLPEANKEPVAYLSQAYSLPAWLIKPWHQIHGLTHTTALAQACNRKPSLYLRANPLKVSVQDLAQALQEKDLDVECHGGQVRVQGAGDITQLPGFDQGWFVVQDMAAYHVVDTLDPQSDWHILDLCAAPGTKTTHLAEHTKNKARIMATDIQPARLGRLQENIDRLGHTSIQMIDYTDVAAHVKNHGPFDAILLDVPCSNTGVFAKRPELRYRLQAKDITALCAIQKDLLNRSVNWLASQGTVCYSTCSSEPQENQDQIKTFLADHPDLTVKTQHTLLPTAQVPDHDGSFVAVLERH